MKTIFKYKVEDKLQLPLNGKIVHAGLQHGELHIWVEFDKPCDMRLMQYKERAFKVFGTSHEIIGSWEHIASYFEIPFVWHLYEDMNYEPPAKN